MFIVDQKVRKRVSVADNRRKGALGSGGVRAPPPTGKTRDTWLPGGLS